MDTPEVNVVNPEDNDSEIPSFVADNSSFKIRIDKDELFTRSEELTPRTLENRKLKAFINDEQTGLTDSKIIESPDGTEKGKDALALINGTTSIDVIGMQMEDESDSESDLLQ